jgi:predicted CoA-binding protein
MPLETDEALRALLSGVRTIAVLGIKAGAEDDAFRVPRHMQACGWRILPVNPRLAEVLGAPCAATLAQIAEPIDLVNVFRAPAHVPAHVDEILALTPRPKAVWLQLGIRHDASAARLEAAGIAVVQDRCLMVDQRRLGVRPS